MDSPDLATRLTTTGQLLVRSGAEIGRILDSMVEERTAITAKLPTPATFVSQLVHVEPDKGFMLLSYCEDKAVNEAALAIPKLILRCDYRGSQFAFSGANPQKALHRGVPCIQCELPTLMLAMQQRRKAKRVQVPLRAPVTCTVRMGPLTFETQVVDVSLDGMGILVSDAAIPACAGTRLERARIRHPQHDPIGVDLEVRYVNRVKLPNGERATRIGCKIISSPQNLEELIRLFIVDLH